MLSLDALHLWDKCKGTMPCQSACYRSNASGSANQAGLKRNVSRIIEIMRLAKHTQTGPKVLP